MFKASLKKLFAIVVISLFVFFEKLLLYVVKNHCTTTINHKNFNEICFFFLFFRFTV